MRIQELLCNVNEVLVQCKRIIKFVQCNYINGKSELIILIMCTALPSLSDTVLLLSSLATNTPHPRNNSLLL